MSERYKPEQQVRESDIRKLRLLLKAPPMPRELRKVRSPKSVTAESLGNSVKLLKGRSSINPPRLVDPIKSPPHNQPAEQNRDNAEYEHSHCSEIGDLSIYFIADSKEPDSNKKQNAEGDKTFLENIRNDISKPKAWLALLSLIVLGIYTCETRRTNNLTQQSLAASKDQARIAVRPWVGLPDDHPGIQATPIEFDGEGNAHIKYAVTMKNFGNHAAQNMSAVASLLVTEDLEKVNREQKEMCGDNYVGHRDMGFVLFPGKDRPTEMSASRYDRSQMISKSYTNKFQGWLVGCIGYRDQFMFLYHTGFIYRMVDERMNAILFDATPGTQVSGIFTPWRTFVE